MNGSRTKRIALGLIAFASCVFALAAATTGSISLSGNEPGVLEITATAAPTAAALPMRETVADLAVGSVTERSNKKAGYTVTLGSANALLAPNAGPALRSAETADFLPYSIKYGGRAVVFGADGTSVPVSVVSGKTSSAGIENVVTVSFDGANAFLDEAVYSDVLTFSIIAK